MINFCTIIFGWISYSVVKRDPITGWQNNGAIYVFSSFFLLLFVSAFRGDFATDYQSYQFYFNYFKQFGILDIFHVRFWQEPGYTFLNIIIGTISQHELAIMIATSLIIIYLFYYRFVKDSPYIWLTVLMFISVGTYYTSFNMIRQMIAIAITFAGAGFLYEKKYVKYLLIVGIASTFHFSALVMIPLGYLLIKFNPTRRNMFFLLPIIILLYIFIDNITMSVVGIFYQSYLVKDAYGMEPINLKILVVPVAVSIFALVNRNLIELKNLKNRIWINSTIFYLIFVIFSIKIKNFNRIAEYFLPFLYLLVPSLIFSMQENDRIIYITIIPVLLTLYVLISIYGSGFDPYYFFWNN